MRIRNNGSATRSYRAYRTNSGALAKNLEKLSTGYKINRAADGAAELSVSEKMRAQIAGLQGAQRNAKHGIGLIQTSEGALQEQHEILNRMLELSVESANGTYDDAVDRNNLQKEMAQLAQELDRIADSTNFNGIYTLDGHPDDDAALSGDETILNHYHTHGFVESDAMTGDSQTWTFGGYTCPPFNSSEYGSLSAQLNYFVSQYNANVTDTGWKTKILYDNFNYINSDGTNGGAEEKYCICFFKDGTDTRRQVPEGAYEMPVYGSSSQEGEEAQLQGNKAETTGYIPLLIGETGEECNILKVPRFDMHADNIGLAGVNISTQRGALRAISKVKNAINVVSDARGTYGALQNRLEHTINYLGNAHENIQDAESVIRDADMADEMMKYTKNQILRQSSQSMLAQANLLPEGVLRLMQ